MKAFHKSLNPISEYTMCKHSLVFSLLLTLLTGMPCMAAEAESAKIAVLPLKVNADRDLSYLRDGIADMFASRLAAGTDLAVVKLPVDAAENRTGVNDDDVARRIGRELKVGHVLYGSLTVFKDSISMDAKVAAVEGEGAIHVFSKPVSSEDALIPAVQAVSREIATKLTSRSAAAPVAAPKPEAQPLFSAVSEQGEGRAFWKSQDFNLEIKGISAGDVDGDGSAEIVFITVKELHVFRVEKDRLAELAATAAPSGLSFLCVDVADINGNNKAEIFVTALNTAGDRMESLVLEWDGKTNAVIAEDMPWFFRVLLQPQKKPLLAGQKKGFDEPFQQGVYEMIWKDGAYSAGKKFSLPLFAAVTSLAVGDLRNDGGEAAAFLDDRDRLQLFLSSGESIWKSEEQYGGSENFIDYSTSGLRDDNKNRVYLSQRIIPVNPGRSAKNELLVVKNDSLTGRFFDRFRSYGTGWFERLLWDGIGMSSKGMSAKITGYISDFYLVDQEGDGEMELLAAVVSERNSMLKDGKSTVITYKFTTIQK